MAFTNPVATTSPGYGAPTVNTAHAKVSLTTAATTALALPAQQPVSRGKVHVRVINGGAANTTCALQVTATDGTATITIGVVAATTIANQANSGLDVVFEYCSDLAINSVSVVATMAGDATTGDLEFEVIGNP